MGNALSIALQNQTSSNTIYAYVTGTDVNNNNALFFLQADGRTNYYPTSPPSNGSPLAADCSIPLGPIGSQIVIIIPQLTAARIVSNDIGLEIHCPSTRKAEPFCSIRNK
jgi:hypothetical protein